MRAAFRAVMHGKQVAALVPTTILAQQHGRTFADRMADYPMRIEVLSRFRTKKEQTEVVDMLVEAGMAVLVQSSELPELIRLANRCLVFAEGVPRGELVGNEITQPAVMACFDCSSAILASVLPDR